jgi:hypothetical protein
MNPTDLLSGLPGEAWLRQGLADYQAGRRTIPACLVAIASTRLTRAGLLSAPTPKPVPEPERELYRLLGQETGDAYARYNALVRELVSFENALDSRLRRRLGQPSGETSCAHVHPPH